MRRFVQAGTAGTGAVSIFVSNATYVILDINAYFTEGKPPLLHTWRRRPTEGAES